jgi:hypothetical protein
MSAQCVDNHDQPSGTRLCIGKSDLPRPLLCGPHIEYPHHPKVWHAWYGGRVLINVSVPAALVLSLSQQGGGALTCAAAHACPIADPAAL